MYFPVADIEVAVWIPPLASFAVSFFTSMGGISGAFLLLPFQVSFLGYTAPSVSATNQVFNIVAIPSGVYRYCKEKRMVWPLAWVVVLGTLPGVILGAMIRVNCLSDPGNFRIFAGLVLGCIGIRMARDLLRPGSKQAGPRKFSTNGLFSPVVMRETSLRGITYEFSGQTYSASIPFIFAMSLAVGIVGGAYGIGGGAIIAPFFVSICGLHIHTVAGAALLGTFVTSVAGVVFYQILAAFHTELAVARLVDRKSVV